MFERLRLWFWKWFRPAKYWHHVAEERAKGYQVWWDTEETDE